MSTIDPYPPVKKFDPSKPFTTRNGCAARILCTDLHSDSGRSIIAAVNCSGNESVQSFFPNGQAYEEPCSMDLVNVPPPQEIKEFWFNIYADGIPHTAHYTKTAADWSRGNYCIACVPVKVTYREGEGI